MIKIGILSSHNGTGFLAIQRAIEAKELNAKVVVVVSNNTNANVLKSAQKFNITNYLVNNKVFPNDNLDEKITQIMQSHDCDYIFLSGYMKKIGLELIDNYENRIINSHPALLPKFGGKNMYGRFVHEAVISSKETHSGCTIHYVNKNYDEGEHILQNTIKLDKNESVETLESKIKELEAKSIIEAFKKLS